jgi:hypothetical protein
LSEDGKMAQPLTVCRLMVWSGFIDALALRAPQANRRQRIISLSDTKQPEAAARSLRTIMKTIAIIGSSGTNTRPWTDAFLKAGWHIRSLVRDPRKIERGPHLTATAFDFSDPQSHAPALAGVDVLALITPAQPDQVAWESALIAAAQRAAVGGIMKLSCSAPRRPRRSRFSPAMPRRSSRRCAPPACRM